MTTSLIKKICIPAVAGFSPPWEDEPGFYSGFYLGGTGEFIFSRASGARNFINIPCLPGSIIYKIQIKWGGGLPGDGVKAVILRRDDTSLTAVWDPVTTFQTFVRANPGVLIAVSDISGSGFTMVDNYSYVCMTESVVASDQSQIYAILIWTRSRLL